MNKLLSAVLVLSIFLSLSARSYAQENLDRSGSITRTPLGGTISWNKNLVQNPNFTDLGNYIIELPDFTDPAIFEKAVRFYRQHKDYEGVKKFGCTTMIKRNKNGEVIAGRNMDLEPSQKPAYIYRTTYGKYRTFSISYSSSLCYDYEKFQNTKDLDVSILYKIPFIACDSINEKGLYLSINMREVNKDLTSYGLHSYNGELKRADGVPWKDLRVCNTFIPQLVTQNCATVAEAIEFIKNSYDWYAISDPNSTKNGWNLAFIIGDAYGEYGLIELAQDTVNYIPYQYGQANFYITPKWNVMEIHQDGIGRLQKVEELITPVQTLENAMDAMNNCMSKHLILWIGETERAAPGSKMNSHDRIIFKDDKGNPQIDWRSDYVNSQPILDDGRMIISKILYENALKSTYDPNIKRYIDNAADKNTLLVDDGSVKFYAGGKELTFTELEQKAHAYELASNSFEKDALAPYYQKFIEMKAKQTARWNQNDLNFEAVKASVYASMHIRYDEKGTFSPSALSKYEKVKAFLGMGVPKNEKYLRDDGTIWMTIFNVGVNCTRKQIKIKFWENDNITYTYQW